MRKVLMCDPPSGWKYGFPKPIPPRLRQGSYLFTCSHDFLLEWLVSEGYPQSEIDVYGDHFYCRYYETEVDDG